MLARMPGHAAGRKQSACARLDPEGPVERLFRIGNEMEKEIAGVPRKLVSGRMKHDNLAQDGVQLVLSAGERAKMQAADRASGKAAELQMGQRAAAGEIDTLAEKRA